MSESESREVKKCKESKVIQTHLVISNDLNPHKTLFGGQLMSFIDNVASISAFRHSRGQVMTAAMDSLNFLAPIYEGHSVCLESYVSGVGSTSMEVFVKVTGEELTTGDRYLAATCFATFAKVSDGNEKIAKVPLIEPTTSEEEFVCSGYQERKRSRLANRTFNENFSSQVTNTPPWLDEKIIVN